MTYLFIDVKDKVTKKYHPIRFYVMDTDVPRILISHAASFWLGLVKVLCDNKAPWIKRQVASIDKKSDFRAKDGPKMTSTQRLGSSSRKREFSSKTVTSGKVPVLSPRMHNFKNAKIQGKSDGKGSKISGDVDINDEDQHSQDEASASTGKELKTTRSGNSVLSGPNKGITDNIKDGPLRKGGKSASNAKLGPKMKQTSKKAPHRKYYMPSNDTQTFQIKVTSSVSKTPTLFTGPTTKANCLAAEKLQSTMNQVQYHAGRLKTSRNYIPILLTGLAV